jgi:hypothetical protein
MRNVAPVTLGDLVTSSPDVHCEHSSAISPSTARFHQMASWFRSPQ